MAKKPTSYNGPPPSIRDPKTGKMQANPEYAKWKAEQDKLTQEAALADAQATKAKADAQAAKIAERQRKAEEKATKAQERINKAAQKAAEKAEKDAKAAEAKAKVAETPIPTAPGAYVPDPQTWEDKATVKNFDNSINSPENIAKRSAELKAQRAAIAAANTTPDDSNTPRNEGAALASKSDQKWSKEYIDAYVNRKKVLTDSLHEVPELTTMSPEELAAVNLDDIKELKGVRKLIMKAAQAKMRRDIERSKHTLKDLKDMTPEGIAQMRAEEKKKIKAKDDEQWYEAFREQHDTEEYMKAGHGIRMALGKSMLTGINKLGGDKLSAKGLAGFSNLLMGKTGTNALIEQEEKKGGDKGNKAILRMAEAAEKSAHHLDRIEHEDRKHHERMEHMSLTQVLSVEGLIEITKKGFHALLPKPSMSNRAMWAGGMGLFSALLNRGDDNNFFGSMLKGVLGEDGMKTVDGFMGPLESMLGINDENRGTVTKGTSMGILGSLMGITPGVIGGHAIGAVGDIMGGSPITGLLKLLAMGGGASVLGRVAGSKDPLTELKTIFVEFKDKFMKFLTTAIDVLRRTYNAISMVATGIGKITGSKVDMGHFEPDGTFKNNLDDKGEVASDENDSLTGKAAKWAAENPKTAFALALAARYGSVPLMKMAWSAATGMVAGVAEGIAAGAGAVLPAVAGAAEGALGAAGAAAGVSTAAIVSTVLAAMVATSAATWAAIYGAAWVGDSIGKWIENSEWYKKLAPEAKKEREEEAKVGADYNEDAKMNFLKSMPEGVNLEEAVKRFNSPQNAYKGYGQITPEDIEKYRASKLTATPKFDDPKFVSPVPFQAPAGAGVTVNQVTGGNTIVQGGRGGGGGASPGVGNAVAPMQLHDMFTLYGGAPKAMR